MYTPKFGGSESVAHLVSIARNIGVDLIGVSDF